MATLEQVVKFLLKSVLLILEAETATEQPITPQPVTEESEPDTEEKDNSTDGSSKVGCVIFSSWRD